MDSATDLWHVSIDSRQLPGTYTTAQLKDLLRQTSGQSVLLWKQGMESWIEAHEVPELGLRSPSGPPPLPRRQCSNCGAALIGASCASCGFGAQTLQQGQSVRREDKKFIMSKGAQLPDVCVKCGEPARGVKLKKTYYWHTPILYLLICAGVLVYAIVAMIVRKRADVQVPLCQEHLNKRRNAIIISLSMVVVSIAVIIAAISLQNSDAAGILAIAGLVLFLGSLIYAVVGPRVLIPTMIDEQSAHFKGAHERFLSALALSQR